MPRAQHFLAVQKSTSAVSTSAIAYAVETGDTEIGRQANVSIGWSWIAAGIRSALGEIAIRTAGGNGTSCRTDAPTDARRSRSRIRVSLELPGRGGSSVATNAAAAISGAAAQT